MTMRIAVVAATVVMVGSATAGGQSKELMAPQSIVANIDATDS